MYCTNHFRDLVIQTHQRSPPKPPFQCLRFLQCQVTKFPRSFRTGWKGYLGRFRVFFWRLAVNEFPPQFFSTRSGLVVQGVNKKVTSSFSHFPPAWRETWWVAWVFGFSYGWENHQGWGPYIDPKRAMEDFSLWKRWMPLPVFTPILNIFIQSRTKSCTRCQQQTNNIYIIPTIYLPSETNTSHPENG